MSVFPLNQDYWGELCNWIFEPSAFSGKRRNVKLNNRWIISTEKCNTLPRAAWWCHLPHFPYAWDVVLLPAKGESLLTPPHPCALQIRSRWSWLWFKHPCRRNIGKLIKLAAVHLCESLISWDTAFSIFILRVLQRCVLRGGLICGLCNQQCA